MVIWLLAPLLLAPACGGDGPLFRSEVVVPDADFPAALAVAPDGRLFYTELRNGNIRVVSPDGELQAEPFAHIDVASKGEWGLLGLALAPDFAANGYVYVYFMRSLGDNTARPIVMRLTDRDGHGVNPTQILDELPTTDPPKLIHAGGRIRFGPDGYLYVSIGEFGHDPENSQDLSTVKGKILRVNEEDGSPPPDNPFLGAPDVDPRILAYGIRNSFGLAFHPQTGKLYVSDNGQDNCDEINLIVPGRDYGWPGPYLLDSCGTTHGVQPIYNLARSGRRPWELGSTVGPTGMEFVTGEIYPEIRGDLLVCDWNTGTMRALSLGGPGNARVLKERIVIRGCELDVAEGPDGQIYFSSRNEIRRLLPN